MKSAYTVGWNDLAHGILTWTGSDKWASPLEWAKHCRSIAIESAMSASNKDYYRGVCDAVAEYERTGQIAKK